MNRSGDSPWKRRLKYDESIRFVLETATEVRRITSSAYRASPLSNFIVCAIDCYSAAYSPSQSDSSVACFLNTLAREPLKATTIFWCYINSSSVKICLRPACLELAE